MPWALCHYRRQSQRRRRLDPVYAAGYAKAMNMNFEKGYARKVSLFPCLFPCSAGREFQMETLGFSVSSGANHRTTSPRYMRCPD